MKAEEIRELETSRVSRQLVTLGGIFGFLAVGLGAFGAHALKAKLEALGTVGVFQTASQYHLAHALAILLVAGFAERLQHSLRYAMVGWLFALGILLFSGSLYLFAITNFKALGILAPFGGISFLAGWTLLIHTSATAKQHEKNEQP